MPEVEPIELNVERRFDLTLAGSRPNAVFVATPKTDEGCQRWRDLFRPSEDTGEAEALRRLLAGPQGDPIRDARKRLADAKEAELKAAAEVSQCEQEWRALIANGEETHECDNRAAVARQKLDVAQRTVPVLEGVVRKTVEDTRASLRVSLSLWLASEREAAAGIAAKAKAEFCEAVSREFIKLALASKRADLLEWSLLGEPERLTRLLSNI